MALLHVATLIIIYVGPLLRSCHKLSYSTTNNNLDSDGTHTPQSENDKVGIYIAKYSYNPSEMSPNPTFDLELPLTAGDYLCVYGDMDDDGFYHGQLMTGESGMVPSNFIERVVDEDGK